MTTTTPREVLETIDAIYNGMCSERRLTGRECERILTALREGGHLRTPGTVEVCEDCKVDENYFMDFGCKHCLGDQCPIKNWKQVTK